MIFGGILAFFPTTFGVYLINVSYLYFPVFLYYVYDYGFFGVFLGHLHHHFTLGHFNVFFFHSFAIVLPYFTFICHLSGLELF